MLIDFDKHSIKPMSVSLPDGSLNIPLNDAFVDLKKKKTDLKDACIYEKTHGRWIWKKVQQNLTQDIPIPWDSSNVTPLTLPENFHI